MASCGVCGKKIPFLESYLQVKDGCVCCECILKTKFTLFTLQNKYEKETKRISCIEFDDWALEKKRQENKDYTNRIDLANKFVSTNARYGELEIDENNRIVKINNYYYEFAQIVSYELYEDNSTIMKGGLGRALVGDVLFGAGGAFLGAMTRKSSNVCQKMEIVVNLIDNNKPIVKTISLIDGYVKRDSDEYNTCINKARQMMLMLDIVNGKVNKNNNNQEEKTIQFSVADEIRKFKSLLDDGIITQEEFDKKKKDLLNM